MHVQSNIIRDFHLVPTDMFVNSSQGCHMVKTKLTQHMDNLLQCILRGLACTNRLLLKSAQWNSLQQLSAFLDLQRWYKEGCKDSTKTLRRWCRFGPRMQRRSILKLMLSILCRQADTPASTYKSTEISTGKHSIHATSDMGTPNHQLKPLDKHDASLW